jgi:hypothetical protein
MPLFRLEPDIANTFAEKPEIAMGVQIGRIKGTSTPVPIFDAQVALLLDDKAKEQIENLLRQDWMMGLAPSSAKQGEDFQQWSNDLDSVAVEPLPLDESLTALQSIFGPFEDAVPTTKGGIPVPTPPFVIRLPIGDQTGADDVYYRYERFPTSRRVNQSKRTIEPETYAVPSSELEFMPTGFSAVARCALPTPLPACWRWEIKPTAKTYFRVGAVVPLFGQSGGGVEVYFPKSVDNRGPIADPVVLPRF